MKEIKGYLIDRTTGVGISGKSVTFRDLAGTDIATGTHGTVYQVKDSVTQGDGSFSFKCELSPGPIQVEVTASGSEKKERKWDEQAQMNYQWSSDISRVARASGNGVIKGFLSELALSIVSGHTFRIAKGAALVDGAVWSLEDLGGGSGYDILGTTNPGGSGLNPRLDLVSLRQYKQSAAGQNSGKQDVLVTLGTSSNTVPAIPTNSDWTAFPIGVLSTPEGGSTKTIYADRRVFFNDRSPLAAGPVTSASITPGIAYQSLGTVTITGLNPDRIYDGRMFYYVPFYYDGGFSGVGIVAADLNSTAYLGGPLTDITIWRSVLRIGSSTDEPDSGAIHFEWPLSGVTGVTSLSLDARVRDPTGTSKFHFQNIGKIFMNLSPR